MNPTDRLQSIKARAAAATEGPWEPGDVYPLVAPTQIDGYVYPERRKAAQAQTAADAEFISHSRADVDWLVGEVEWLLRIADRNGVRYCLCSRADRMNDRARKECPIHGEPQLRQIATLQARLDAVVAVVDKWEATQAHNRDQLRAGGLLETTPTPEAFRAALNGDD